MYKKEEEEQWEKQKRYYREKGVLGSEENEAQELEGNME